MYTGYTPANDEMSFSQNQLSPKCASPGVAPLVSLEPKECVAVTRLLDTWVVATMNGMLLSHFNFCPRPFQSTCIQIVQYHVHLQQCRQLWRLAWVPRVCLFATCHPVESRHPAFPC